MALVVEPLDQSRSFGIVLRGLTEEDLHEQSVRAELRQLWLQNGVIVFKGEFSTDFQVEVSKVMGELEIHPIVEYHVDGHPELISLDHIPDSDSATIYEVEGVAVGGWLPWHFDFCYAAEINRGGLLRALILPSQGGDTSFIDGIEAYDTLPDEIKTRIEGLEVVYQAKFDYTEFRYVKRPVKLLHLAERDLNAQAREQTDFLPVTHPVVFIHDETGRKVLNVAPTCAQYIKGMDNHEGHELLKLLTDHINSEAIAYRHVWQMDEMVLWDNWRMLHTGHGTPANEVRRMIRTTIKGDYAMGRALAAE